MVKLGEQVQKGVPTRKQQLQQQEKAKDIRQAKQARIKESKELKEIAKRIDEGKIRNIKEIPEKYRDDIDVSQKDLDKIQEVRKENIRIKAYNKYLKKAKANYKRYGFMPTTVPEKLKGTKYEEKIKSEAERINVRGGALERLKRKDEIDRLEEQGYDPETFYVGKDGEMYSVYPDAPQPKRQLDKKQEAVDLFEGVEGAKGEQARKVLSLPEYEPTKIPAYTPPEKTKRIDRKPDVVRPVAGVATVTGRTEPFEVKQKGFTDVFDVGKEKVSTRYTAKGILNIPEYQPALTAVETTEKRPVGYGSQMTAQKPLTPPRDVVKDLTTAGFGAFKKSEEYVQYDPRAKYGISFGADKSPVQYAVEERTEDITGEQRQAIVDAIGAGRVENLEKGLTRKYQARSQKAFERRYKGRIISGDITFEEAVKEFESSDYIKELEKSFQKEYTEKFTEMKQNIPTTKQIGAGFEVIYLQAEKGALRAIKTPTATALVAGGGYLGFKGLSGLMKITPKPVLTGWAGYETYSGAKDVLSPTTTPVEKATGVIRTGLGGAYLGASAYRYVRFPKTVRTTVKTSKLDLKASETLRKDVNVLLSSGNVKKSIFPGQQLASITRPGSRVIVSSRGQGWRYKFWKSIGANVEKSRYTIYEGVPYTDPKGYKKALKRLTKYGATKGQAKRVLRYQAPKIYKGSLEPTRLDISNKYAYGYFRQTYRPIKQLVDKRLGIYTRGGRGYAQDTEVFRQVIGRKGSEAVVREAYRTSDWGVITKKGTRATFTWRDKLQGRDILTKVRKFTIPPTQEVGKTGKFSRVIAQQIKGVGKGKVKYVGEQTWSLGQKYVRDMRKGLGFRKLKPSRITKTPFQKDATGMFDTKNVKRIVEDAFKKTGIVSKTSSKPTQNVVQFTQSKYAGTGTYEQTSGGQKLLIKAPASPDVSQLSMRDVLTYAPPTETPSFLAKQTFTPATFTAVTPTTTPAFALSNLIKTKTQQKSVSRLKSNIKRLTSERVAPQLKEMLETKEDLRQDLGLRQDLRYDQDLRQDLRTDTGTDIAPIITPKPKDPTPPRPPTTKFPKFSFDFDLPKSKKGKKKKKRTQQLYQRAYLPDFTSRALGLRPEVISEKQAQKRLKKIMTGLELRRPVKIKKKK